MIEEQILLFTDYLCLYEGEATHTHTHTTSCVENKKTKNKFNFPLTRSACLCKNIVTHNLILLCVHMCVCVCVCVHECMHASCLSVALHCSSEILRTFPHTCILNQMLLLTPHDVNSYGAYDVTLSDEITFCSTSLSLSLQRANG